jgi:hypothetical protein
LARCFFCLCFYLGLCGFGFCLCFFVEGACA